MQSQKIPFNTNLGSIDFGPTTHTKEPPTKGTTMVDKEGNVVEENQMQFFRQKFLTAMTTE